MTTKLINTIAEVISARPNKRKNDDEVLLLTIDCMLQANVPAKAVGFAFGVLDEDEKTIGVDDLLPGLWTEGGSPISKDIKVTTPAEFSVGVKVTLTASFAGKKQTGANNVIGVYQGATLNKISFSPGEGGTAEMSFKIYCADIEGASVGDISELIKRQVHILVEVDDLFDKVEKRDGENGGE